ncbi:carbohydrate porin [Vibrio tapetis subsp. quintayensis]|uniref:carbohydrate porin n=1 Tax=Vibrio tapetis TaxID=52443 RepID=UPI0025B2FE82|nr:carbohydrate porin [Vibrio tapetis]MDN3678843.1 carbohydrate porin [Vibrio tapetis subsp. quintayensis]
MKNFKIVPLSLAVAAAVTSLSTFAADADIDALTKRIQELETKLETDYVYDQQQAILTPDTEVPLGLVFSGYARYGAHHASGDNRYVQVGSSGAAVGRLGNEANGGEIQFAKAFKTDAGAIWDVVFMLDQWGVDQWSSPGGVNLKKAYAGVTNVFASQPDVYMWAGRDFHQRPQQGLNDYFWMSHDGQGGGFHNFNFGGAKFDLAFVAQVDSGDGGALGNDNGRYAITSKLHSIDAGIGNLDIYANYGFASTEADTAESYEWVFNDTTGAPEKKITAATKVSDKNTWQIGATLGLGSSNKLVMKYTDGGDNSAFDLAGDKKVGYVSIEGGINPSDRMAVDYLASYKTFSGEDTDDKNEYSAIVRPMYNWDDVHSTWLEAGYAMEDFANGDEKNGWKVTLSQNISMGGLPWSRPMLRFYATVGDVQSKTGSVTGKKQDTVSVGAMWEAWW